MAIDVEEHIKRQLEDIDITEMVEDEVRALVSSQIRKAICLAVDTKVEEFVKVQVMESMKGEVVVSDGFGKTEKFPSFDVLFKTRFSKMLKDDWKVKGMIEKIIKAKVTLLFNQEAETIRLNVIEQVGDLYAVKKEASNG